MPHIRFRSVKSEEVRTLSASLGQELAGVMQTSADNFTFELVQTQFYAAGAATESYPFVEVLWFARPQDVQDRSAALITSALKALGNYEDVVVVFQELPKQSYYENGQHF